VKVATAETDLFVSVMVFAAFVVFWDGKRKGSPSVLRAIAAGLILAAAGLVKGPQPLGFLFLGLGVFFLSRGRWMDFIRLGLVGLIPAIVLAAWYFSVYQPGDMELWLAHSRLRGTQSLDEWLRHSGWFALQTVSNFLPGWPLLLPNAKKILQPSGSKSDELLAALVLFASLGVMLLVVWPGARDRYAMPAILPTAAAAGLVYDALVVGQRRLTAAVSVVLVALLGYQMVVNWLVMPLALPLFDRSRYYGQFIAQAVALRPGPVYAESGVYRDFFVYVPAPLREVPLDTIATAPAPIWALVRPQDEERLRVLRPNVTMVVHVTGDSPRKWRLLDIREK